MTKQMASPDLHIPPNTVQTQLTTLAKVSVTDAKADSVARWWSVGQVYVIAERHST